jgi:hypothetical protein
VTDSEMMRRLAAVELQVEELKSVQDLLVRLLSTTRPLSSLLEYYGATETSERALYQLLDELVQVVRGPRQHHPSFPYFQMRVGEILPAIVADRSFVQTLIDTLQVERPAYRELHAYMAKHRWPVWD